MNETMYEILHAMIKARRDYWRIKDRLEISCGYSDALDLIEFAHNNDIGAMSMYSFFPIEEEEEEEEEDVNACMRESLGGNWW